jgi:hypothetical protein
VCNDKGNALGMGIPAKNKNGNSREKQALKGRNKGLAMSRPFRARADALQ